MTDVHLSTPVDRATCHVIITQHQGDESSIRVTWTVSRTNAKLVSVTAQELAGTVRGSQMTFDLTAESSARGNDWNSAESRNGRVQVADGSGWERRRWERGLA